MKAIENNLPEPPVGVIYVQLETNVSIEVFFETEIGGAFGRLFPASKRLEKCIGRFRSYQREVAFA